LGDFYNPTRSIGPGLSDGSNPRSRGSSGRSGPARGCPPRCRGAPTPPNVSRPRSNRKRKRPWIR